MHLLTASSFPQPICPLGLSISCSSGSYAMHYRARAELLCWGTRQAAAQVTAEMLLPEERHFCNVMKTGVGESHWLLSKPAFGFSVSEAMCSDQPQHTAAFGVKSNYPILFAKKVGGGVLIWFFTAFNIEHSCPQPEHPDPSWKKIPLGEKKCTSLPPSSLGNHTALSTSVHSICGKAQGWKKPCPALGSTPKFLSWEAPLTRLLHELRQGSSCTRTALPWPRLWAQALQHQGQHLAGCVYRWISPSPSLLWYPV